MNCHWQELLSIVPFSIRDSVDKLGKNSLLEIRLRVGGRAELILNDRSVFLDPVMNIQEIAFTVNAATKYSPWTAQTIRSGYVTSSGGHRIGICGSCVYENSELMNITSISSVCIRVARQYPGISKNLYLRLNSILIIGLPGAGKTTLLRDLICEISNRCSGAVVVLDERREIFPSFEGRYLFERGKRTDVLSGVRKPAGLDMALRTMSPSVIALDEISCEDDAKALQAAANCGVRVIATAHAGSRSDLNMRPIYRRILTDKLFQSLVVLHADRTWHEEEL